MSSNFPTRYYPYIILLLGVCFYLPFLGRVNLFDWDEINFAESAREMLLTKNYSLVQIDFKPFWEKPPLFFWMQAFSMRLFGINAFAARLPNAVIGCITILCLYFIGKKEKDAKFGFIWALIYWGSLTPHLYFKSGIIDPTFNLFIFLGVYYMIRVKNHKWHALLAGLCIGLAVLTKGPVGGLIWALTMICYWLIYKKRKPIFTLRQFLIFSLTCLSITSVWIVLQLQKNGIEFFIEFIRYQIKIFTTSDAGHGEPFYYHFVVLLFGCFPMSVFCIPYLIKKTENEFEQWMKVLFWVVLILFSLSTTKIVHYSSMAYFPVSFLAASYLFDWINEKIQWPIWSRILFLSIGIVLALLIILIPLAGMNANKIIPFVHDEFAARNLEANVHWTGLECGIGLIYLAIMIYIGTTFKAIQKSVINKKKFLCILTASTAIMLLMLSVFIVPKIERYSQGAAIDFFTSKAGEDCYIDVIGYKSYAQYFYSQKPIDLHSKLHDTEWLLRGQIDKPTFLVSKVDRMAEYRDDPHLEILYEKNGFVFMKRK